MNPANANVLDGFTKLHSVDRIVSDGQSGAARGALDAAIELGLSHGGWCAVDKLADDGPLGTRYDVHACAGGFGERCARNLRSSDGTLLLTLGDEADLCGRTRHARDLARKKRKASAHLQLEMTPPTAKTIASVRSWLQRCRIRILHVTGPLERVEPGIAMATKRLLLAVLRGDA